MFRWEFELNPDQIILLLLHLQNRRFIHQRVDRERLKSEIGPNLFFGLATQHEFRRKPGMDEAFAKRQHGRSVGGVDGDTLFGQVDGGLEFAGPTHVPEPGGIAPTDAIVGPDLGYVGVFGMDVDILEWMFTGDHNIG